MQSTRPKLLMGIDVGGSKTHVRIESALDGTLLVDEIHQSDNWPDLNDAIKASELLSLVEARVGDCGQLAALVAGVHGNDSPEQALILGAPLRARYTHVKILNDSHLLILAHGVQAGTGIIAGTGSSATATMGDAGVLTVGGWGWLLGDEGGAVGIVRDAAKQVLDAYDRDEKDPLSDGLLSRLALDHPHALPQLLAGVEPRIWAKAASVVFDAARLGSARAQAVIDAHALALAGLIALLKDRGGDVQTIVCAGGVISSQPALFDAFKREVQKCLAPMPDIVLLTEPPVAGALNLARHMYRNAEKAKPNADLPAA